MNYARTAILMAAMTGLFLALGWALGGQQGMTIALVVATGMNFFSYWFSDRMVLRMYGAREIGPQDAPRFHAIVAGLAARARSAHGRPLACIRWSRRWPRAHPCRCRAST